jgi:acyl-CoA synthetase (AMP-forming)/AMP-acid ligase II
VHLIDPFDRGVRLDPDGVCFQTADDAERHTYAEVAELSHRIAVALQGEGLGRDAHVAVLSPNAPLAFACVLGIIRADATWIPLNTRSTADDLVALLELTECDALFYHHALGELAERLQGAVDRIRRAVCLDDLSAWMAPAGARAPRPPDDPGHDAFVVGTGGTTGRSKAVRITHLVAELMSLAFAAHMPEPERPPVMAMAAPMTHAAGPICFPVFARAGQVIVHEGVHPGPLLESIAHHRVSRLFLPPTAIYALLGDPLAGSVDVSSLRHFIYAAAPMSVTKLQEAMDCFGPVMTQTYGQAEVPMIATVMTPEDHERARAEGGERLASAGRASLVAEVAIMSEQGELLGPGETGEIVARGNLVTPGYYRDLQASEGNRRPGGWHGTSDVGRMDEAGYVYIVDRLRDMIITGGFNVWPSEIEQLIHGLGGVSDCAVIGLPDEKWGEAVTAVIELRAGGELSEERVKAAVREQLGPVKTPKQVIFRELPRSPVGKVLKRALREEYWAGRSRAI